MTQETDNLEDFTPYLLNQVASRYNQAVETTLRQAGVTVPKMRTLAVLAKSGPCTVNELSLLTVIKQSTLSRTLDAMEHAGLLRRASQTGDGRVRRIELTEAGREAFEAAFPEMLRMKDAMLGPLSAEEQDTLNALLRRIYDNSRTQNFLTAAPGPAAIQGDPHG